jgi:predicted nucleic acid-binding protein
MAAQTSPAVLVDTSIFIAVEEGRPVEPVDALYRVCVATVTELEIGALLAEDPGTRRRRRATLARARAHVPIPYDERVSAELSRLLVELRQAQRRAGVFDCLVAATALSAGLPVYTQDRDFEVFRDHAGGPAVVLG